MTVKVVPIIVLVFISLVIGCISAQEDYHEYDVIVKDLKLYVEGKEFFIKAMAYQPAPLGILDMKDSGYGGGGYCSAKKTVFGEYKSACFGSDYVDGSRAESNREPQGPAYATGTLKPWWLDVWKRDFPKMKEMGVNTIRLYNLNPITKHFLSMYPQEYDDIVDKDRGAEHLPFLDLADEYGFKVIVPILQDEAFLKSHDSQSLDRYIESQVKELGGHPALLMWITGNEMNVEEDSSLLGLINDKMDVIRERMKTLHNRVVPITHAVVDLPSSYEHLAQDLKVDVFTTNAGYRDVFLNPLWEGDGEFKGWRELSKEYNLPLFIGEIGMHQDDDEITQERPYWFNQQWKAIVSHMDDGCVGAAFFEYSDELQKDGKQRTMGAVRFVEVLSRGKSSKDPNNFFVDQVQEKEYIYDAIKSGINGPYKQYHMNADVFDLVGRNRTELPNWNPLPAPRNSSAARNLSIASTVLVVLLVTFFVSVYRL